MTTATTTKLPDDLRDVRCKLEELAAEGRTGELIDLVVELLARMRATNNALTVRLQNALRELYGRKSQKVSTETLSSLLAALGHEVSASAAEAATAAAPPDAGTAPATSPDAGAAAASAPEGGLVPSPPEPPKPPRVRGGRSPLPKDLPREQRKVRVPDVERRCPRCGAERQVIGHRSSPILEFVPAHFKLIEELREKLACPRCPEAGVATAPSEKVMERGRPGPGLLANILVEKFCDAMPLYRQAQQYERFGVALSPSTLGDWAAFGIDTLAPIARRITERVLGSPYVRGDDTGMRVLDRDHPNGVKLGHMWAFVGTEDAPKPHEAAAQTLAAPSGEPAQESAPAGDRAKIDDAETERGPMQVTFIPASSPEQPEAKPDGCAHPPAAKASATLTSQPDEPDKGAQSVEVVKRAALHGPMLVAFHYAPNWKAEHPEALLQKFTGVFQGDGYPGYASMLREDTGERIVPEDRRLGCAMHIRAKFEKAAKAHDARAAVALAYFKALYRIEDSCKEDGLSPEERKARRDKQSLPVVNELYKWIRDLHPRLVPNTPLYIATQYAINQEAAFRRCFTDGRFEIDNGEVERQIRPVALGRKNYLFAGSDKGAERLAIAYTVFGSCRLNGANPLAWATDVLGKLQDGWPMSRLDELLPDAWVKTAAPQTELPKGTT